MDKPARNLELIDALLADNRDQIQPHEFTMEQFFERMKDKDASATKKAAGNLLLRLVSAGRLQSRQVVIGGRRCNAYSETSN